VDNFLSLTGGKLTTYRLMAEQTVDRVGQSLERKLPPCSTASKPLLEDGETKPFSGIAPPPVSREAVSHYCRNEWATCVEDIMLRRTSWGYYHRNKKELSGQIARWMAEIMGWDASREKVELERFHQALDRDE